MNNLISNKIVIGTANFGKRYGIRKVKNNNPKKILDYLRKKKINWIDTSGAYKNSEKILGKYKNSFKIITKNRFSFKKNMTEKDVEKYIAKKIDQSFDNLQRKKIYAFLIQDPKILLTKDGDRIFKKIQSYKKLGKIKKIGISIYDIKLLKKIIKNYKINIVQIPFNIANRNIFNSNIIKILKKKRIEIHARSIFLQGILLLKSSELPNQLYKIKKKWKIYEEYLMKNKVTAMQICLRYILNFKGIKKIVIGIDSKKQLEQILNTNTNIIKMKKINFGIKDKKLIDPRYW